MKQIYVNNLRELVDVLEMKLKSVGYNCKLIPVFQSQESNELAGFKMIIGGYCEGKLKDQKTWTNEELSELILKNLN